MEALEKIIKFQIFLKINLFIKYRKYFKYKKSEKLKKKRRIFQALKIVLNCYDLKWGHAKNINCGQKSL